MPDTRPDLTTVRDAGQRTLALAHWHLWLVTRRPHSIIWRAKAEDVLEMLEADMQPSTSHQLALARGRYFHEVNAG
jgi:hypothetical protein